MNKSELISRIADIEWEDFEAKINHNRIGPAKGGHWQINNH